MHSALTLQGFFTIYRNLFARLAAEERNFTDDELEYPNFGMSDWPWSPVEKHESNAAKFFYNTWTSFSTVKDFAWMDYWDLPEAPDRRTRR